MTKKCTLRPLSLIHKCSFLHFCRCCGCRFWNENIWIYVFDVTNCQTGNIGLLTNIVKEKISSPQYFIHESLLKIIISFPYFWSSERIFANKQIEYVHHTMSSFFMSSLDVMPPELRMERLFCNNPLASAWDKSTNIYEVKDKANPNSALCASLDWDCQNSPFFWFSCA